MEFQATLVFFLQLEYSWIFVLPSDLKFLSAHVNVKLLSSTTSPRSCPTQPRDWPTVAAPCLLVNGLMMDLQIRRPQVVPNAGNCANLLYQMRSCTWKYCKLKTTLIIEVTTSSGSTHN